MTGEYGPPSPIECKYGCDPERNECFGAIRLRVYDHGGSSLLSPPPQTAQVYSESLPDPGHRLETLSSSSHLFTRLPPGKDYWVDAYVHNIQVGHNWGKRVEVKSNDDTPIDLVAERPVDEAHVRILYKDSGEPVKNKLTILYSWNNDKEVKKYEDTGKRVRTDINGYARFKDVFPTEVDGEMYMVQVLKDGSVEEIDSCPGLKFNEKKLEPDEPCRLGKEKVEIEEGGDCQFTCLPVCESVVSGDECYESKAVPGYCDSGVCCMSKMVDCSFQSPEILPQFNLDEFFSLPKLPFSRTDEDVANVNIPLAWMGKSLSQDAIFSLNQPTPITAQHLKNHFEYLEKNKIKIEPKLKKYLEDKIKTKGTLDLDDYLKIPKNSLSHSFETHGLGLKEQSKSINMRYPNDIVDYPEKLAEVRRRIWTIKTQAPSKWGRARLLVNKFDKDGKIYTQFVALDVSDIKGGNTDVILIVKRLDNPFKGSDWPMVGDNVYAEINRKTLFDKYGRMYSSSLDELDLDTASYEQLLKKEGAVIEYPLPNKESAIKAEKAALGNSRLARRDFRNLIYMQAAIDMGVGLVAELVCDATIGPYLEFHFEDVINPSIDNAMNALFLIGSHAACPAVAGALSEAAAITYASKIGLASSGATVTGSIALGAALGAAIPVIIISMEIRNEACSLNPECDLVDIPEVIADVKEVERLASIITSIDIERGAATSDDSGQWKTEEERTELSNYYNRKMRKILAESPRWVNYQKKRLDRATSAWEYCCKRIIMERKARFNEALNKYRHGTNPAIWQLEREIVASCPLWQIERQKANSCPLHQEMDLNGAKLAPTNIDVLDPSEPWDIGPCDTLTGFSIEGKTSYRPKSEYCDIILESLGERGPFFGVACVPSCNECEICVNGECDYKSLSKGKCCGDPEIDPSWIENAECCPGEEPLCEDPAGCEFTRVCNDKGEWGNYEKVPYCEIGELVKGKCRCGELPTSGGFCCEGGVVSSQRCEKKNTCSDGTPKSTCVSHYTGLSSDNPRFCTHSLTLVNNCGTCGCPLRFSSTEYIEGKLSQRSMECVKETGNCIELIEELDCVPSSSTSCGNSVCEKGEEKDCCIDCGCSGSEKSICNLDSNECVSLDRSNPNALLIRHAPYLSLSQDDEFYPIPVEAFFENARLEILGNIKMSSVQSPENLAKDDFNSIWANLKLRTGNVRDFQGRSRPTVYGRIVTSGGTLILQYWYLYFQDGARHVITPDWQLVQVNLDQDLVPKSLQLSCYTREGLLEWDEVPVHQNTHPIILVQKDTHLSLVSKLANYSYSNSNDIKPVEQNMIRLENQEWLNFKGTWFQYEGNEGVAKRYGPRFSGWRWTAPLSWNFQFWNPFKFSEKRSCSFTANRHGQCVGACPLCRDPSWGLCKPLFSVLTRRSNHETLFFEVYTEFNVPESVSFQIKYNDEDKPWECITGDLCKSVRMSRHSGKFYSGNLRPLPYDHTIKYIVSACDRHGNCAESPVRSVKAKKPLTILFVPVNWKGLHSDYLEAAKDVSYFIRSRIPLDECENPFLYRELFVEEDESFGGRWMGWSCDDPYTDRCESGFRRTLQYITKRTSLDSINACANDYKGKKGVPWDYVVGLVEESVGLCGKPEIGGYTVPGRPVILAKVGDRETGVHRETVAHEIGHKFGLDDQYCDCTGVFDDRFFPKKDLSEMCGPKAPQSPLRAELGCEPGEGNRCCYRYGENSLANKPGCAWCFGNLDRFSSEDSTRESKMRSLMSNRYLEGERDAHYDRYEYEYLKTLPVMQCS